MPREPITENRKRRPSTPVDIGRGLQCTELEVNYVYFQGETLTVYFKQGTQVTIPVAGAVLSAVAAIEDAAFAVADPPR